MMLNLYLRTLLSLNKFEAVLRPCADKALETI